MGGDHQLVKKVLNGDYGSFEAIYNKYYQSLFNYGCQFDCVNAYVHDSIQDLFIDLWNNRDRITITYSLQAYLLKSLRYKIQYQIKKDRSFSKNISDYLKDSFTLSFDEQEYLNHFKVETEALMKLKKGVQTLAPKQRELIYLIYFNNLSYDEASKIMGITKKTAYNQVHSAIKNLRVALQDLIFLLPVLWLGILLTVQ